MRLIPMNTQPAFSSLRFIALALLAALLGYSTSTALAAGAKVDYEKEVKPIFDARCVKCHGEKRGLGGLKLHNAEALAALEEDGLLVPEDSESSEVFARLILPDDDKHRMPKGGKPLEKGQIETIKNWIDQGALLTSAKAEPKEEIAADADSEEAADKAPPAIDLSAIKVEPATKEVLAEVSKTGASVVTIYAKSPLLSVGFPSRSTAVTNEVVATIAKAGPQVVWLDLSGSEVTDAVAGSLSKFENLVRLHIERTVITDETVKQLAGLDKLEYLNLYGTKVTDASIETLIKLPALKKVYLWQTGVSYDAAKRLMAAKPHLEVSLGWNHPGVVRDRLTSELERISKQRTTAEQEAKDYEAKLAEAQGKLKAASDREAALKKELESLDKPAGDAKEAAKDGAKEEPAKADKA